MTQTNGIAATLEFLKGEVNRLENNKATKESVANIKEGLEDLKDSFEGLKKILITVALSWVAGTGLFLIAVLTLAARSAG